MTKKESEVDEIDDDLNENNSNICIDANKIDENDDDDDFVNHHSFNGDGDIIEDNGVVDYNDEIVGDVNCYYESKPLFSTLHIKQFLCATVCTSEVIIWCFSTSMVVARINVIENCSIDDTQNDHKINVTLAKFDEEVNVLYLATSNGELHQYSLNGQLIRRINLKVGISAIDIVNSGFSMFSRFIVTGHTDGSVKILKVDMETREFVVIKEKNLFHLRIAKIVSHRDSYSIDAYVIPSRLI